MAHPEWYDRWCKDAFSELVEKQDQMKRRYGLGDAGRWDYDMATGQLVFGDEGRPRVRAEIQVVGTVSPRDWLWGWANASLPKNIVEDVRKVREFGIEHGIEELTAELLEDDEPNALGWSMTAVAAKILDAPGAYRPRSGIFFVCRSIELLS